MAENEEAALQRELDLLQRLYARGRLTEADYHDEIARLGIDPTIVLAQASPAAEAAHFAGPVAAGDGDAVDARGAQGPVLDAQGPVTQQFITVSGNGARVVIGEERVETPAVDRESALGRYLRHLIAQNRYLQLQGIRAGGKLVHIELAHIYVRLRATRQRTVQAEEMWLEAAADLAPGEELRERMRRSGMHRADTPRVYTETVTVNVDEALAAHARLVVLGDPGSGKTTLLRYLTLGYARSWAEGRTGPLPDEPPRLPLLIPLRRLGAYLKARRPADDGVEGHALLLEHYAEMLQGERLDLPSDFFDAYLDRGAAVVLLDGLDEVADPDVRRRVARLVEAFTRAYPQCRYVVASRIVGYTGAARLGEAYITTTVRDFDAADIVQFLHNWHLAVGVSLMGLEETTRAWAARQTAELEAAIQANARVRELAINPLLLTVIALVHRERVKLPDRRAELYAEAVAVLLGKWDEARGVQEIAVLEGRPFEADDKKLLLQRVALRMHETAQKEVESAELRAWLLDHFRPLTEDEAAAHKAVERFLQVIEERTGLLVSRGEGVYGFSHLTFQEYLSALGMAARDDYVDYTVQHCGDAWWREAVLLEAGFLSTQSQERTTRLIQAIADCRAEAQPYHNLMLAAEALRDVGESRVSKDLEQQIRQRLREALEAKTPPWRRWLGKVGMRDWLEQRSAAMETLVRAGAGYWTAPYGEPEWVEIPAGEFWMGSEQERDNEKPVHRVALARYWIARTPVTNAQYRLFIAATGHAAPEDWENEQPPKGKWSHPVVNVRWYDALAYCRWLAQMTGKAITLPSEAQWEKAARGDREKGIYPWGNRWDSTKCNTEELGVGDTTPVGVFQDGASPYGVLDMAGNVWEWTRSLYKGYPYDPNDGREAEPQSDSWLVLRGGVFCFDRDVARCAYRNFRDRPHSRHWDVGFRVVVSPSA